MQRGGTVQRPVDAGRAKIGKQRTHARLSQFSDCAGRVCFGAWRLRLHGRPTGHGEGHAQEFGGDGGPLAVNISLTIRCGRKRLATSTSSCVAARTRSTVQPLIQ